MFIYLKNLIDYKITELHNKIFARKNFLKINDANDIKIYT